MTLTVIELLHDQMQEKVDIDLHLTIKEVQNCVLLNWFRSKSSSGTCALAPGIIATPLLPSMVNTPTSLLEMVKPT